MRDMKKKMDAEEMLIVHKPALQPDPDRAGRGPGAARVPALDSEELALLTRRLAAARDPKEKKGLLGQIQRRFGNEKAAQALHDMREPPGDDDMKPRPPAGPKKDKA